VPEGAGRGPAERLAVAVAALSVAWLLGSAVGRQVVAARVAERARVQLAVARDIHDVVGHALGVIRAQTGVTLTFPDAGEQELRATLVDVESRAREALEDVQTLVRTLRDPERERAPGPDQLASVITATRAAGVRVDASIDVGGRIGEGAGVVVFRIVQEALSNVVRHAPGAECSVAVREEAGAVLVRVRDSGRRVPATDGTGGGGTGVGLRGLRERAGLIGGTVTWQCRPEGGFEVNARLPLRAAR
jgi:signal transduction histidine kinase